MSTHHRTTTSTSTSLGGRHSSRRHGGATMKTFGRVTKKAPRLRDNQRRKSSVSSGDLSALVAQQQQQQQHKEYHGPMTRSRAPPSSSSEPPPAHELPSCSYSDDTAALVTPPSPQSFLSTGTTDLRAPLSQQENATPSSPTEEDKSDHGVGAFLDRLEARLERSLETARARGKYGFDFETGAPLADGPIEWTRVLPS